MRGRTDSKGLLQNRALSTLLGVALTLSPLVARANAPIDTVWLANGGRVRGTVIVDDPTGVKVQLADGTVRTLTRNDVKRIEYAEHATAKASAPAPTPAPAPASAPAPAPTPAFRAPAPPPAPSPTYPNAAPPSGAPLLTIFLDSTSDTVTLERGPDWTAVCEGPCGLPVEPYAPYRVSGAGVRSSAPFTFGETGPVTLKVRTGSSGAHTAGLVLFLTGMVGAALGAGFLVGLSVLNSSESIESSAFTNAGITGAVGVAVAIPGLILANDDEQDARNDRFGAEARLEPLAEWRSLLVLTSVTSAEATGS